MQANRATVAGLQQHEQAGERIRGALGGERERAEVRWQAPEGASCANPEMGAQL